MSELHIGKPYIEHVGEKVRLCSNISIEGASRIFYYEVDKEWESALCTTRSDAFLVSLVQYAMANGYNISWEVPVTDRLCYQLRTIFIPVISKKFNKLFNNIELIGDTTDEQIKKDTWSVATGASGGVDSFYSILKHINIREKSQRLTHLLYVSMSNHADSEERLRRDFELNKENVETTAKDLNLPLISLYSNESEFFFKEIVNWAALRFAGMAYSLQNLISVYYFSSAYPYESITFGDGSDNFSSGHFDLFTLMIASTQGLNFVGTGGETTRSGKVEFIENNEVVKKHLFVCNYDDRHNCSSCDKCMRTQMQLYADGVLADYKNVFDLAKFNKNKNKYITKMLYRKSCFDSEILEKLNKNQIASKSSLKAKLVRPVYVIWQRMKNSKFIMSIFYKYNLDYKLYGTKMAEAIRYSKGIERRKAD